MKSLPDKLIIAATIILLFYTFGYGTQTDYLIQSPIVLEKNQNTLSDAAGDYLEQQVSDKVKVWIFFTDKGIFDQEQYDREADKINFTGHVLKRRSKIGMVAVTFADLPVFKKYIKQIIDLGAKQRRISRWLNAASFEIDIGLLDTIKNLPFVYKINPVASYKKIELPEIQETGDIQNLKMVPMETTSLDYGPTLMQNQMLNVPAVHDLGYSGQGIIVAILDGGFRKTHDAFAQIINDGRLLDEYDFVFDDDETQNETEDNPSQHNHGTSIWSVLGGYDPGIQIGPAYGASFLLAKTEDVRSETIVEEDNWVAGMEWADSLGADVISTSLGYSDWYEYSDMDGLTAITSAAASTAASLGIIVCKSMGNAGPDAGTLSAPADAFDIIAVGAVSSTGTIATFSSRGPTYDGRTKPEVCALGLSTRCAEGTSDSYYTIKNGTSLSTPLIGGACALLLSANPSLTPFQLRQSIIETADNADTPDNTYGWGIPDILDAYNWGANFTADTTIGWETLEVDFQDSSSVAVSSWKWYFGDGDSSDVQNPTHTYNSAGSYDVTLITESTEGTLMRLKEGFITILADTLSFVNAGATVGDTAVMSVNLTNTQELENIIIPINYGVHPDFRLVKFELGSRTSTFDSIDELFHDTLTGEIVIELKADILSKASPLQPGAGEIAQLYFEAALDPVLGGSMEVDTGVISGYDFALSNSFVSYAPYVFSGEVMIDMNLRGDADNSGNYNILDISYIVNYLYRGGPAPINLRAADADSSGAINILDVTYLINYLYRGGPPPAE